MKYHLFERENTLRSSNHLIFWFSAALLIGVLCGVITAYCLDFNAQQALYSDVTGFLSHPRSEMESFWLVLWNISRLPLILLLFAFTCFGVIGVPILIGLQGYLLSFSTAAMVRLLGLKGILLGVAGFGIQAFFLVPCVLLWSTQSFSISKQFLKLLIQKKPSEEAGGIVFPRGFLFALLFGVVMLTVGALADHFLTKQLITFVSNTFILQ